MVMLDVLTFIVKLIIMGRLIKEIVMNNLGGMKDEVL